MVDLTIRNLFKYMVVIHSVLYTILFLEFSFFFSVRTKERLLRFAIKRIHFLAFALTDN